METTGDAPFSWVMWVQSLPGQLAVLTPGKIGGKESSLAFVVRVLAVERRYTRWFAQIEPVQGSGKGWTWASKLTPYIPLES